jgi:hypothetical protein
VDVGVAHWAEFGSSTDRIFLGVMSHYGYKAECASTIRTIILLAMNNLRIECSTFQMNFAYNRRQASVPCDNCRHPENWPPRPGRRILWSPLTWHRAEPYRSTGSRPNQAKKESRNHNRRSRNRSILLPAVGLLP